MKKPIRVSWMRFYVLAPVQSVWGNVKDFFIDLHIKLIGGWYCEYCKKYHGRRVLKYKLIMVDKDGVIFGNGTLRNDFKYCDQLVCSLGRDAGKAGEWTPGDDNE